MYILGVTLILEKDIHISSEILPSEFPIYI